MKTPSLLALASIFGALAAAPFIQAAETQTTAAAGRIAENAALNPAKILADMERVADWQIKPRMVKNKKTGELERKDNALEAHRVVWLAGVYFAGHMALIDLSPNPKYADYAVAYGEKFNWKMQHRGGNKYHADDFTIGQFYVELAQRFHNPKYLAGTKAEIDWVLANPPKDTNNFNYRAKNGQQHWSWCDALFMAPPAYMRLAQATGDMRYIDNANAHYWKTSAHLYDTEAHLFTRDAKYLNAKEKNGEKVFWGRGNGWNMGGLARILQYLPADYADRAKYETQFKEMSAKLVSLQDKNGAWHTSLLDPESFPDAEMSATGLIGYGLAWGVNVGLLDRAEYWPAVMKAWNKLNSCVFPDGKVGSVQPVGEDPRTIKPEQTEIYGSGAYLLFASEMYKAGILAAEKHGTVSVKNPSAEYRARQTVEVPAEKLKALAGTENPDDVLVFDALSARLVQTQNFDGKLLFQTPLLAKDTRGFIVVKKPAGLKTPAPIPFTHARFVPERMDDFAWENDFIAHRAYGPKLITGDKTNTSGIDVWVKSVPTPIVEKWYKGKDYHKDHGEGLDCYDVGTSLGTGGSVIFADGKWHQIGNFTSSKVYADGPIRSVFELVYAPQTIGGREISEVKKFTVDAGSAFTKVETTFTAAGDAPVKIGVGAVQKDWKGRNTHKAVPAILDDKAGDLKPEAEGKTWFADLQQNKQKDKAGNFLNGTTGVAVYMPTGEVKSIEGHWIVAGDAKPGEPFTYYFGAGWSKGRYPTKESWVKAVEDFSKTVSVPAEISFGK